MPRISAFHGIVIAMYYREHGVPHFHATHAGEKAAIAIATLDTIAGTLPRSAMRLVRTWAREHREELEKNWERARADEPWNGSNRCLRISEMQKLIHVTSVEVVGDHRLRLAFEDGTAGTVDASGWEWRGVFAPLRDPEFFATVRLDAELGTAVWPNGADVAPETLHAMALAGDERAPS
ncbi:MAG TPA: DUF4160 domain-containing protein [Thermoleophilaceae bacterium]|jgi:hypothetical protein